MGIKEMSEKPLKNACRYHDKRFLMIRVLFSVGMRRLELPTSTSRTWRASQLCYIPIDSWVQRYYFLFISGRKEGKIFFSLRFPTIKRVKREETPRSG